MIKVVKLVTGEEVICDFNEEAKLLESPAQVVVGNNPMSGQIKIQLLPYPIYNQDKSAVPLTDLAHVVWACPVGRNSDLYKMYDERYGSGLVLP